MRPFRNRSVLALLAAGMMPAAFAQYASPVKVTNATDSPMPVRDTKQTSSAFIRFNPGESDVSKNISVPTCPGGTEFLISSFTAAPALASSIPAGTWGVSVDTTQKFPNFSAEYPLEAYGTGAQAIAITLPAGQPVPAPGQTTIEIKLIAGPTQTIVFFHVHVSGYCGVAFVAPVLQ